MRVRLGIKPDLKTTGQLFDRFQALNQGNALRLISRTRGTPYRAVGFLDDDPGKRFRRVAGVPVVGTISDLESVLVQHRIDLVLYANDLPFAEPDQRASLEASCTRLGAEWREFTMPVAKFPRSQSV